MMLIGLGLAGLAAASSYSLTSRLVRASGRLGTLDRPSERSLHVEPVPRTGGLAILAGATVGFAISFGLARTVGGLAPVEAAGLGSVLGGVLAVAVVSYWSDAQDMSAAIRLVAHTIVGAITVWLAGLAVDAVTLPFLGSMSLGAAALPITVLAVVWMTNLYNFMDGMDGFAGGMTVIGFGCLGWLGWTGGHQTIAWLSVVVVGATAGFLAHNFPPASIFMGDVGSVSLGFLAGALSLMGIRDRLFDVWVPVLVFSPFVVDATVTLVRRLLRGERVWRPHREHYYQRLVLTGWGHRKTVLAEYALMLGCGTTALAYVRLSAPAQLFLLTVWVTVYCVLVCGVRAVEARSAGRR